MNVFPFIEAEKAGQDGQRGQGVLSARATMVAAQHAGRRSGYQSLLALVQQGHHHREEPLKALLGELHLRTLQRAS